MIILDIKNLNKRFGKDVVAVKNFSLQVKRGEFVVLVGPSGCGKTTTLRMIAGLENVDEGKMILNNTDITSASPEKRDIAMVFQDYALYPHLTVYDNIAFPLKIKRVPRDEVNTRVLHVCETLGIADLQKRKPRQLSGGQKQRVAIGRALVRNPKLFLMDEPLSNLDAQLRIQMRNEIAGIHKDLDATIVFVTHDQTEAMTLADRIIVMNEGSIVQSGTPQEVYDYPKNVFVAEFVGSPQINILPGTIDEGRLRIGGLCFDCVIPDYLMKWAFETQNVEFLIGIHPEDIAINFKEQKSSMELFGVIANKESLGYETIYHFSLPDGSMIRVRSHPRQNLSEGKQSLCFQVEKAILFDRKSHERICPESFG